MTDRDGRVSPLSAAGDGALLLCALCGLAGSFLSLYGDPDPGLSFPPPTPLDYCAAQSGELLLYTALFALAALAVWSLPRWWAAGGGAALWGLCLFDRWETVVQGAGLTIRTIAGQFARRVSWGRTFPYDPKLSAAEEGAAVRLFLLLALAGLALILGWGIVRARRWWIAALFTLPPLLPGLLADLYPGWLPFMALCACWCAMLLTDLCKWAAPDRRGALTLAVLPCVAALLAVITALFPLEGYTRPDWARRMEAGLYNTANRAADFFSRFDGPFRSRVTYVGSAEEADLAGAGPLSYIGRVVLQVTSDYDGRLYLRGSSLAAYEGGVWRPLSGGTYEAYRSEHEIGVSPLYFPAMSQQVGFQTYTATVNNVGASGSCVYAPYFLLPQEDGDGAGLLPVEDAYLARRQGQWTHTVTFANLSRWRVEARSAAPDYGGYTDDQVQSNLRAYEGYVYDHYLDVPEDLREILEEYAGEALRPFLAVSYLAAPLGPVQQAMLVALYLDELCQYDAAAPAAPEGVDPVEYFLTEGRRGYCMHYASAAALMLRAAGVPARYVSGFTAECVPDRQVRVLDHAAHAWVEVWVNGVGWYPVEVTPAAAFQWYGQGGSVLEDETPSPGDESLPPEDRTPEPTEEPAPTPSDEAGGASAAPGGDAPGGEDGPAGDGPDLTILLAALKAAAMALGALALLWLIQYLPKQYRARRLSGPDRRRAVLYGYRCLGRMERWGGRTDGRALELAQKARFSRDGPTREELDELRLLVDRERERLCAALDPLPRLLFRYIWGMPRRPAPEGEPPPENPE